MSSGAAAVITDITDPNMPRSDALRVIRWVLGFNLAFVFIGIFFIAVAVWLIVVFVRRLMNTVDEHYRYAVREEPAKRPTVSMALGDDEVYQEDLAGDREDPGTGDRSRSEFAKMRGRLEEIEKHYAAYNKEFGAYVRDTKNREPDDLIDARIVSRKADDYEYENNDG